MKLVPVHSRKYGLHWARVDDADFEIVSQQHWYLYTGKSGIFYAQHNLYIDGHRSTQQMHVFLVGKPLHGFENDHRDRDGLNNQRGNLRVATISQNQSNRLSKVGSSRFKGVSWDGVNCKWYGKITVNLRVIRLGRFSDELEAARAYDAKARELLGEFARTNF